MDKFFLSVEKLNVSLAAQQVLRDIDFFIRPEEQWAIVGAAGSGKTVFAHTLCGRHFFSGKINFSFGDTETFSHFITVVEQQHRFKDTSNQSDFYYQQRYNSFDAERTVTVGEYLAPYLAAADEMAGGFTKTSFLGLLKIDQLLQEPLIQLSNGENKRLQLVKALLQDRQLLILDQPFIGLDAAGRELLSEILNTLDAKGIKLLLITSARDIPEYITHVAELENGLLVNALPKEKYLSLPHHQYFVRKVNETKLKGISPVPENNFELAVKMLNVNIRYGDKQILEDINWEIKKGERWSLSGPNGAGKSTLLSLITSDNPQAYANEIYLFDRKRGSGESIWDIKKKIGYISPELHLYFDPASTTFHAIASGLFDTIGLFRQLNIEQEALVLQWIELMGLKNQQYTRLAQLSLGEQRLILLARALIKNPPLLILDEPCQGLDEDNTQFFKSFIDLFCYIFHTTLIYVSHYQQEIPVCVDHFLRIEQGRLVSSK